MREARWAWAVPDVCGAGCPLLAVQQGVPQPAPWVPVATRGVPVACCLRAAVLLVEWRRSLWPWPLRLLWPTLPRCVGAGLWEQEALRRRLPSRGRVAGLAAWARLPLAQVRHAPQQHSGQAEGGCWGVCQTGQWCRASPVHQRAPSPAQGLASRVLVRVVPAHLRPMHPRPYASTATQTPACAATGRAIDLSGECCSQVELRGCVS